MFTFCLEFHPALFCWSVYSGLLYRQQLNESGIVQQRTQWQQHRLRQHYRRTACRIEPLYSSFYPKNITADQRIVGHRGAAKPKRKFLLHCGKAPQRIRNLEQNTSDYREQPNFQFQESVRNR